MRTIIVSGYPKSGTTWLARLLADALNCPTGASRPSEDHRDIVTEGQDRPAPFIVRRGHFKLVDSKGPLVPRPHTLAWRNLTDQAVIFMVRDPRDIAVSSSLYFDRPLETSINIMLNRKGRKRRLGSWRDYIAHWMITDFPRTILRYEDLLESPMTQIKRQLIAHKLPVDLKRIEQAIERQSFDARLAWTRLHGDTLPQGKKAQLDLLRKGIAGDWKNHLAPKLEKRLIDHARIVAGKLGYV